jgi:hypothetical protein
MRSELQLALLALAVLLLLALYVHGRWQERRLLHRMRDRLHGGVGDALLQAAAAPRRQDPRAFGELRGEPRTLGGDSAGPSGAGAAEPGAAPRPVAPGAASLGSARAADATDSTADAYAIDGAADGSPDEDAAPFVIAPREALAAESAEPEVTSEALRTPASMLRPDWAEDPLLDCSLEIRCARAVDGVSVIDAASVLAHTPWRLPVHFVVWDGRAQQWVLPDRFGYYTDALASLQLADRRTRIDGAELERFVQVVQRIAAALDADVDAPDTARLLVMADDLDRLCARFDIRIGLTVESTGPHWTGPQLRNAAQETGFVPTSAQRWVWCDPQGEALFGMQVDPARMNRLSLELDVAAAPPQARAFRSMVECAWTLAEVLGARVVDDNGALIEARSVDAIDAQLAQVHAEMREAGIEPGSVRARRLYG